MTTFVNRHSILSPIVILICALLFSGGVWSREGKIKNFTAIDAPFEPTEHPDVEIMTGSLSIIDSVQIGLDHILPLISYKQC
jgi:hypothetical protein